MEMLPPRGLRPAQRNARTHSKKQIRQIADSIERFPYARHMAALRRGLKERASPRGVIFQIEYHWAEDQYERLPALAAELAARKLDVILSGGLPAALTAKNARSTVPIVIRDGS
jgi:ABC-type uncharacterized transport system substrate-binding protein